MAVLGLRFCVRAFSSCGKWGPFFIAVRGPLTIAASLVAERRLQTRRLSNCGARAQLLRGMWDLPRPGLEPVSPALAGRFSTTAPPGKPLESFDLCVDPWNHHQSQGGEHSCHPQKFPHAPGWPLQLRPPHLPLSFCHCGFTLSIVWYKWNLAVCVLFGWLLPFRTIVLRFMDAVGRLIGHCLYCSGCAVLRIDQSLSPCWWASGLFPVLDSLSKKSLWKLVD